MTKDRAVATATVSFVRALSCSLDSTVALVETEMGIEPMHEAEGERCWLGIELLSKCVQFWRDDSIAAETCDTCPTATHSLTLLTLQVLQ